MAATDGDTSRVVSWLRTTDWLWMIIAGFYLLAYLFWYVPALARLPRSARDPPEQFPWHWPLDFATTALSGGVLLLLGFRRATEFADGSRGGTARRPTDE
ncbi:hypothetical protein [Halorussus sp. AFM4]|uniref:hypothetical protein n=1 Tax=Halorussus sp. AFM4 TaxID=3421651 RepID=UPI003EB9C5D8